MEKINEVQKDEPKKEEPKIELDKDDKVDEKLVTDMQNRIDNMKKQAEKGEMESKEILKQSKMELIRMKNLVENGVELAGWGSEIEMNNKPTEDGQPNIVKREIG